MEQHFSVLQHLLQEDGRFFQLWTSEVKSKFDWLLPINFCYFCNQCWSTLKCCSIFIISFGYLPCTSLNISINNSLDLFLQSHYNSGVFLTLLTLKTILFLFFEKCCLALHKIQQEVFLQMFWNIKYLLWKRHLKLKFQTITLASMIQKSHLPGCEIIAGKLMRPWSCKLITANC